MRTRLSHIFILALSRPFADRIADFWPLNENKTIVNFDFGPFSAIRRPHCLLLTSKWEQDYRQFCVWPFSALLVQNFTFPVSNLTHLGPLSLPPPCLKEVLHNHWIYPLKQHRMLAKFSFGPLWAPFCSKFHLSGSKVTQVGNRNCVIRVGSSSRSLSGVSPCPCKVTIPCLTFS